MRNLMIIVFLLGSMQAFAEDETCKQAIERVAEASREAGAKGQKRRDLAKHFQYSEVDHADFEARLADQNADFAVEQALRACAVAQ